MSSTALALPSAGEAASTCCPLNRRNLTFRCVSMTKKSSQSSSALSGLTVAAGGTSRSTMPGSMMMKGRREPISCEAASATSSSLTIAAEGEEQVGEYKIGARVRVKAPLKVYHVPRVPEVDLSGKEGHLKQYVALWKGKRISANLPYKVEFVLEIEGRGPVKFFAHLKEDEFDFLD